MVFYNLNPTIVRLRLFFAIRTVYCLVVIIFVKSADGQTTVVLSSYLRLS